MVVVALRTNVRLLGILELTSLVKEVTGDARFEGNSKFGMNLFLVCVFPWYMQAGG